MFSLRGHLYSEGAVILAQSGAAVGSDRFRPKSLRPGTNRGYLLWFQSQILVDQSIRKGWHSLFLNLLANPYEAIIGLSRVLQGLPIFEIHVPATFIDVIRDHPRQGSHVAIPRPMGLV